MGGLGPLHLAGLGGSLLMLVAAFWLLWVARARADEDRRVAVPVLGKVGNPTCLTLGVCLLIGSYHAAAYSLLPVYGLVSVPVERWWIVAAVIGLAVVGALAAEALERRG